MPRTWLPRLLRRMGIETKADLFAKSMPQGASASAQNGENMRHMKKEQEKAIEFLNQTSVFYVTSPTDDTVLVAIDPRYAAAADMISWWDTGHERMKKVSWFGMKEETTLLVVDDTGTEYAFTPMTLAIYNNVVRKHVFRPRDFASEKEMIMAFEETIE